MIRVTYKVLIYTSSGANDTYNVFPAQWTGATSSRLQILLFRFLVSRSPWYYYDFANISVEHETKTYPHYADRCFPGATGYFEQYISQIPVQGIRTWLRAPVLNMLNIYLHKSEHGHVFYKFMMPWATMSLFIIHMK